ncbi:MAG TPA: MupA/Atu3671 family FMN-dependent luciferase-like monooxygenase [Ilumatobacter sp.]|nr:MupA/Atu3671 family FMN-dependent luciferase-like monooxygenase [Ilumatobacter sp.]
MNDVAGVGGAGYRGATAVFAGDELLVVQCAVESRRHDLVPTMVVSTNQLVLDEARASGLTAVDRRGTSLRSVLDGVEYDLLFAIAFEHIIPADLLARARLAVNFHDGPLPEYGGLNVTTWSILGGAREHAVTWHVMSELADRGPILHEERFTVTDDDTAFSLNARCYEAGLASFGGVAAAIAAGTLAPRPQTDVGRRMYRRSERPIVFVDPQVPAVELARAVRAVDLGPRAFGKVGAVRWLLPGGADYLLVAAAEAAPDTGRPVGAVSIEGARVVVQTVDGALVVTDLRTPAGLIAAPPASFEDPGSVATAPPAAVADLLREADPRLAAAEPSVRARLAVTGLADPPLSRTASGRPWAVVDVPVVGAGPLSAEQAALVLAVWLDAVGGDDGRGVAVADAAARRQIDALPFLRAPIADLALGADETLVETGTRVGAGIAAALADGPFLADLVGRDPALSGVLGDAAIGLELDAVDADAGPLGTVLDVVHQAGGALAVRHCLDPQTAERVVGQLASIAASIAAGAERPADVDVLSAADHQLVATLNDTAVDVDLQVTLDAQFRERCAVAGSAPAVSARGVTLTYGELAGEVERMAALLTAAGVGEGDTVGVALERSVDMLITVLATLTVGAHYLPLDPSYPAERLELMVSDSGTATVVADRGRVGFDAGSARVLDPAARVQHERARPVGTHSSDSLAYVIYTSGSTGRPKGVELEHRQVVNFFAAMDTVIDHRAGSVWLAATSLSFDISVLELLWTVTRGVHVVIQSESGYSGAHRAAASPARVRRPGASMSLFYFAADEGQAASGYRLLLESARWADAQGFEAVWTPERHFHHFGAPYPNPSVVAAALAVATERIGIRAGSVVAPLHSPVRVAEEWAVVDNLSRGRVGVSFAAGWQPNDFVLNPAAYATARDSLPGLIDTVQRLWRGESVELPGHDGLPVPVRTLPRPVQAELPVWITSAGSSSTFERAGTLGANLLTHLLGQSVGQLGDNIARYRAAWAAAGHAGEGRVTLMLHTYLDTDGARARETARLPLKGYLGTAVGLLKDFASAFPTFQRAGADADEAFRSLTDDEMSQLLDLAAERYLTTSGLFGTVEQADAMADSVLAAGVDEIACLIDFGIDDELVLQGLDLLGQVHEHVTGPVDSDAAGAARGAADESFADLVERYGVTHFQCTPSLASMLLASPRDRAALGSVGHMLVGGEALPQALAGELRELLPGRLTNMYGPTETTIWSLVHEIDAVPEGVVPIGRPIANTQVHVLDDLDRELPVGAFGQLYIGGDGVARGYRDRAELTAERFREIGGFGRIYATGDVARIRPDGIVEFGGRADFQVKIRGHRIELNEIEAVLDTHPAVARSVVAARGADGATLVAFVVLRDEFRASADSEPGTLRAFLAERLPDVMVPSAVGVIADLPLTPNGKVDRRQLPEVVAAGAAAAPVDPSHTDSQRMVSELWEQHLGRPAGLDDNFFDLGGHSLMAVKLFREFGESVPELALTDIFRYPTVRGFAAHLDALRSGGPPHDTGQQSPAVAGMSRGELRRRARGRG